MLHVNPIIYAILAITYIGLYRVFEKGGEKGWKALLPVYNYYIWLKLLKKPWWWLLIFLIPGVGFMMLMTMSAITSNAMGRGKSSQLILSGLLFFVYLPWLGWDKKMNFLPETPSKPVKKEKPSVTKEWIEAITFAVIAATIIRTFFIEAYTIPTPSMEKSLMVGDYLFVSKASYGARIPVSPLSFPFAQNTLFAHWNSYLDWLTYPVLRLPGYATVHRHDIVVFNFPEGDTVCTNIDNPSYYALCRDLGRDFIWSDRPIEGLGGRTPGPVIPRPLDKIEDYIKRCIGTPGDTLTVRHSQVFINGKPDEMPAEAQFKYVVTFTGPTSYAKPRMVEPENNGYQFDIYCNGQLVVDEKLLNTMDITEPIYPYNKKPNSYLFTLTQYNADNFRNLLNVQSVTMSRDSGWNEDIFPFSNQYKWNVDSFGPLRLPRKGETFRIDTTNLPLYYRIIGDYEHNTLSVNKGTIYINGKASDSYTFKMDYYFMMGDNRHNSVDSRYWGFVPEDHIVGRASFIWMSIKKNMPFFKKFRLRRFFTFVNPSGISMSFFLPGLFIILISIIYFNIKGRREKKRQRH